MTPKERSELEQRIRMLEDEAEGLRYKPEMFQ